jgi:hypothetical protein
VTLTVDTDLWSDFLAEAESAQREASEIIEELTARPILLDCSTKDGAIFILAVIHAAANASGVPIMETL